MAVPSPSSRNNGIPLRIRGKSFISKLKPGFSCFKVIIFLISVQMISMFLMAMTVGNSPRRNSDVEDGAPSTVSQEDDQVAMEKKRRMAELEEGDMGSSRIVYADNHETSALDNYGARKHFAKRAYWDSSAPYLVVGGSDGSGTRAVVNQLVELGANFHVGDRRTMDVHGSEMFHKGGWPPLVNMIMNATHSANYEIEDLPPEVRDKAIYELGRLRKSIDKHAESRAKRANTDNFATATHVGWKAPVSMVLLPLLREAFGPIKFLHVVRDGRDVSLSDNQSPVKKFYNTYYGLDGAPTPDDKNTTTCAMQLWNDMNQQVLDWGRSHSDGETFDYLTIRTEDLVNPETKFDALLQLADFVGSKKTVAELCCVSQREVTDMGKSSKTFKAPNDPKSHMRGRPRRGGGHMGLGVSKREFMADILYRPPGDRDEMYHANPDEIESYWRRKQQERGGRRRNPAEGRGLDRDEILQRRRDQLLQEFESESQQQRHPKGIKALLQKRRMEDLEQQAHGGEERRRLLEKMDSARAKQFRAHQARKREAFGGNRIGGRRHDRLTKEAPDQVKARYGKWVKALEDKPELSAKLHELGSTGLKSFGYEPSASFLDAPDADEGFMRKCQAVLEEKLCKEK